MSVTRYVKLLTFAAIVLPLPALAQQLTPLGTELPISSTTDKNRQLWPAAGVSAAGARLVWEDDNQGILSSVVAKPEAGAGTPAVLVANDPLPKLPFTGTLHEQHQPALAVQGDGSFLLVWTETTLNRNVAYAYIDERTPISSRVVGRRFGADGQPRGDVFEVAGGKGFPARPALAVAGADTWVAWEEADGAGAGVHFRSLDAKGHLGKDVLAGAGGKNAAIAATAKSLLVAWDHGDQQQSSVSARLFATSGSPLGAAAKVSSGGMNTGFPAAAAGPAGDFLLAWQGGGPDATFSDAHVYGQLVRQKGSSLELVGSPQMLSTGEGTRHLTPALASLADGKWLAGWVAWKGFVPLEVDVVTLDAAGTVAGHPVRLNDRRPLELGTIAVAGEPGQVWASWVSAGTDGHSRIRARAASTQAGNPPAPPPSNPSAH